MNHITQLLQLTVKINILLAVLLWFNTVRCLDQNGREGLTRTGIPWAFSPPDLMYLAEKESELVTLMKNHQSLRKSEAQLELVSR